MIHQFDVFRNPDAHNKTLPLLVVVQSSLLGAMHSQVVVPLARFPSTVPPFQRLYPTLTLDGVSYVLLAQQIGAVPARLLKQRVGSLENARSAIIQAIDFLLAGV